MLITLQEIKEHLNISESFFDDDIYLTQVIEAAEDAVAKHLNVSTLAGEGELPSSIRQQIKILVGILYQNREGITYSTVNKIPLTYEYLGFLNKNYKI